MLCFYLIEQSYLEKLQTFIVHRSLFVIQASVLRCDEICVIHRQTIASQFVMMTYRNNFNGSSIPKIFHSHISAQFTQNSDAFNISVICSPMQRCHIVVYIPLLPLCNGKLKSSGIKTNSKLNMNNQLTDVSSSTSSLPGIRSSYKYRPTCVIESRALGSAPLSTKYLLQKEVVRSRVADGLHHQSSGTHSMISGQSCAAAQCRGGQTMQRIFSYKMWTKLCQEALPKKCNKVLQSCNSVWKW